MGFNIVEIEVITDYTNFSNAVRFHLNVPVTAEAAAAITQALSGGVGADGKPVAPAPWDAVAKAITDATSASAPAPVEKLVEDLLAAYAGKSPAPQPDPPPES